MSEILVILPPASWPSGAVGGDEQMFYRKSDGRIEARTIDREWQESFASRAQGYNELRDVEAFYVDEDDDEPWRSQYITEDELDAILRAD